jgi:hypothetical protein
MTAHDEPTPNPYCSNCGDTRGGPYGHETNECRWNNPCNGCDCERLLSGVCLRRAADNIAQRIERGQP